MSAEYREAEVAAMMLAVPPADTWKSKAVAERVEPALMSTP
jgi:hypothetical protein